MAIDPSLDPLHPLQASKYESELRFYPLRSRYGAATEPLRSRYVLKSKVQSPRPKVPKKALRPETAHRFAGSWIGAVSLLRIPIRSNASTVTISKWLNERRIVTRLMPDGGLHEA